MVEFGESSVLNPLQRFKTTLRPRCEGFFSVVARENARGRSRIVSVLKVSFNTRNKQVIIYDNFTGKWRKLAETGNNIALYVGSATV